MVWRSDGVRTSSLRMTGSTRAVTGGVGDEAQRVAQALPDGDPGVVEHGVDEDQPLALPVLADT